MMVTCLIMKPSTCQPFETRTQMANEDKQNISMLIMFRASCRHSYLNICCFLFYSNYHGAERLASPLVPSLRGS